MLLTLVGTLRGSPLYLDCQRRFYMSYQDEQQPFVWQIVRVQRDDRVPDTVYDALGFDYTLIDRSYIHDLVSAPFDDWIDPYLVPRGV